MAGAGVRLLGREEIEAAKRGPARRCGAKLEQATPAEARRMLLMHDALSSG